MSTVVEAVLARLRTVVDGMPVYDGGADKDKVGQPLVDRYAVVFIDDGRRWSQRLDATPDDTLVRWQVTSVGTTGQQARWVAEKCRDSLLDVRLVADGWLVGVVQHANSEPIRRDDDLPGKKLFYAVDGYEVTATH